MKDSKERKREIKKVLLNNLVLTEDKKLAVGPNIRITLWGGGDGAGEAMFLGVRKMTFAMESEYGNNTKTIYKATELMKDIGRMLDLENASSEACVLVRHIFFKPVVLVLEEQEIEEQEIEEQGNEEQEDLGQEDEKLKNKNKSGGKSELVLTAYSSRALLSGFSIRHAVKELERVSDGKIKRFVAPKAE
jgi:hypothetical protein